MSLGSALSIANSGLAAASSGFGVIAQNVANAQTPFYGRAVQGYADLSAGGFALGVESLAPQRLTDFVLESSLFSASGDAGYGGALAAALAGISPALGSVGSGNDLAGRLAALGSAFSTLLGNPADTSAQAGVVNQAASLAGGINALSAQYQTTRQGAQDSLVSDVAAANTALTQLGQVNLQITAAAGAGRSTADLENTRAGIENTLATLIGARFLPQADGSVLAVAGGVQLPLDGSVTLQVAPATLAPGIYYPGGGLGGVTLGGSDITPALRSGSIGADLALRDQVVPQLQAGLDEFAAGLAQRFDAQGLRLFSDGQGNVPATSATPPVQAGYVGFASAITVNPAVASNPALVRDGTQAVVGSPTGASAFTPNPQNLPGFTGMITRVLSFALGNEVQAGVAQPGLQTTGLGPAGNLSVAISGNAALGGFASALTAAQAQVIGDAQQTKSDAEGAQASLSASLTAREGVSTDSELSRLVALQNAYGANAKIVAAIQQAMSVTLNMIGP